MGCDKGNINNINYILLTTRGADGVVVKATKYVTCPSEEPARNLEPGRSRVRV